MMTRNARIDEPEVTVGAPAQQGGGRDQIVVTLLTSAAVRVIGRNDQPGSAAEVTAAGLGQVAGGLADLAAFHRGTADDARPDPERARGQVVHTLEPHPHRPDEGVALLLGVVAG